MSGTFKEIGGGLLAEKPATAELSFALDFTEALVPGDKITGASWTITPTVAVTGLAYRTPQFTDTTASAVFTGGTSGAWYVVACEAVTQGGERLVKTFPLLVTNQAMLGAGVKSVFPDLVGAVASLRRDRLVAALSTYAPDADLSDEFLLERLVAAERGIERELRVFLTPREMVPPGTPSADRQALVDAGEQVEDEPGYDYDPGFFQGNTWGFLQLRQARVISVSRMWFTYPNPAGTLFTVPADWIRLDPKPGRISLVPTSSQVTLPLNAWIMSVVGGGRTIPLMLQVRYRAGLENAARDFPDILSLIRQQAVLDVLQAHFIPSSGSVSADGLSQSISYQAQDYQDAIAKKVKKLLTVLHGGPRMIVL